MTATGTGTTTGPREPAADRTAGPGAGPAAVRTTEPEADPAAARTGGVADLDLDSAAAGLREVWGQAPDRLRRAAAAVEGLRGRGLYLAPVRHHSPACAVAVRRAIEELRPAVVLIEGPEEYSRLVPELLHEETRPPVALLSLPGTSAGPASGGASFYPLATFSPEWVALRAAHAVGAEVRFCDRPAADRTGAAEEPGHDPFARTLMSERYLAHSRSVAALARRLGCRDHDEVWDHLFEARRPEALTDWRATFDDVFAWAALSRLDYEDEVLAGDGSLDREARMAGRAAEALREAGPAGTPDDADTPAGNVLVVTGAFHTLAIAEALAGLPEGGPVRERWPDAGYGPAATGDAWLIRYDHERLDALRGYGAGMPSPGFYERLHAAGPGPGGTVPGDAGPGTGPGGHPSGTAGRRIVTEVLVDVARAAAERGHQVSTPQVASAASAVLRLADLRRRPVPARTDVLDAITSCFVTDDGGIGPDRPLGLAIAEVFGGRAVGQVPAGAAVPPLVRDARERVRAVGLDIDTTIPRTARLDARRTASHRARRQVLALLDLLDCGFGRQIHGPDHVAGRRLGLIGEEWEYCWTPVVEARLVELSHLGATVEAAVVTLLRREEEELRAAGTQAAADGAAVLVARAAVVGLTAHLPRLVALVARTLDTDRDLASVTSGARRLLGLWRSRVELDLGDAAEDLLDLVSRALATAAYLVPDTGRASPEDEEAAVATVLELRALVRDAGRMRPGSGSAVLRELARLHDDTEAAPAVRGALLAAGSVDGEVSDDVLVAAVRGALRPGADPGPAVRFLGGVLRAAPDLLVYTPELFDAVDGALRDLTPEAFLAVLPDLRRGFTWLRPTETHRLAERVAERTGSRASDLDVRVRIDEKELAAGLAVERELAAVLARDGLAHWSGGHA